MCKQKIAQPAGEIGEAYEGQTTRLVAPQRACSWGHGSFPWWTLWLIWPVVMLIKSIGTQAAGTLTTAWAWLGSVAVPANVLIIAGLIVLGAVLLRRR
jgi:hypothetical protein